MFGLLMTMLPGPDGSKVCQQTTVSSHDKAESGHGKCVLLEAATVVEKSSHM
jgi:hypothetical protein